MKNFMKCVMIGLTYALALTTNSHAAKLSISPNGNIEYGNIKITVTKCGSIKLFSGTQSIGTASLFFHFSNNLKYKSTSGKTFFKPVSFDFNKENQKLSVCVEFSPTPGDKKKLYLNVSVKSDRTLSINYRYDAIDKSLLNKTMVLLKLGSSETDGLKYFISNEGPGTIAIDKSGEVKSRKLNKRKIENISLFTGSESEYSIVPTNGERIVFLVFNSQARADVFIYPPKAGNSISFELHFPKTQMAKTTASPYSRKGIDFYACDKLKIPNYKLSRNLVINPSFESRFRHWDYTTCYKTVDIGIKDSYTIDNTVSYKGVNSLKFTMKKGTNPPMVGPFPLACKPGETYTYSFYAKSDKPGVSLDFLGISQTWGVWHHFKRIKLTQTWKRYAVRLKTKNNLLFPVIGEFAWKKKSAQTDANVWIDCVQLEEGKLTDYTERPLSIDFISDKPDGLFYPGKISPCQIMLRGKAGWKGKINMTLKDFFGRKIASKEARVKLDKNGEALIAAIAPAGTYQSGIFILEVNLNINGIKDYDFFRYTILPAPAEYKNKSICGIHVGFQHENKKFFDRLKRIGFGSLGTYHYGQGISPERSKFLAQYDFLYIGNSIASDKNFYLKKLYHIKKNEITLQVLDKIEKTVFKAVKMQPHIKIWKTLNEPDAKMKWSPDVAVILAKKIGDVIKKAQPNAIVLTPDPYNMFQNNLNWYDEYLKVGGAALGQKAAIHIYRTRPECPDIELDSQKFFALLKKYNYTGNVYWSEGMMHPVYVLPQLGINSHIGCVGNFYRALSYDMGYGEKIASAYNMRYYLVGFKYANRVKMIIDWNYESRFGIGLNWVPRALCLVPNVLGRLIGDSKFIKNIEIGKDYRCYLFEDEKNTTAVAWSYNTAIDFGNVKAPLLTMNKPDAKLTFIDMTGNEFAPKLKGNRLDLTIESFPVFIKIDKKNRDKLIAMLETLEGTVREFVRFKAEFKNPDEISLMVLNKTAKVQSGNFKVNAGHEISKQLDINLNPYKASEINCNISSFYKKGFFDIPVEMAFKGETEQTLQKNIPCVLIPQIKGKLTVDEELKVFATQEMLPMPLNLVEFGVPSLLKQKYKEPVAWAGNKDLSTRYKMAWSENGLYLAFEVTDNVHHVDKDLITIWKGDSIQMYFDTGDNGKWNEILGNDNDDYVYDILPDKDNPVAFRSMAPEFQVAFLKSAVIEKNIKIKVLRKDGKSNYEVFIPKLYINPIEFKKGRSFGFAVLINDNDNDYRKRGLTTTPKGTEPHRNPALWTSAIFY